MAPWLLILWVCGGNLSGGCGAVQVAMPTQERCQTALTAARQAGGSGDSVNGICIRWGS